MEAHTARVFVRVIHEADPERKEAAFLATIDM
jgi:hypothetical protein